MTSRGPSRYDKDDDEAYASVRLRRQATIPSVVPSARHGAPSGSSTSAGQPMLPPLKPASAAANGRFVEFPAAPRRALPTSGDDSRPLAPSDLLAFYRHLISPAPPNTATTAAGTVSVAEACTVFNDMTREELLAFCVRAHATFLSLSERAATQAAIAIPDESGRGDTHTDSDGGRRASTMPTPRGGGGASSRMAADVRGKASMSGVLESAKQSAGLPPKASRPSSACSDKPQSSPCPRPNGWGSNAATARQNAAGTARTAPQAATTCAGAREKGKDRYGGAGGDPPSPPPERVTAPAARQASPTKTTKPRASGSGTVGNNGGGAKMVDDSTRRSNETSHTNNSTSGALFYGLATTAKAADGSRFLNDYMLLQDVGRGATGRVTLAYSLSRNKTVAIKIMKKPKAKKYRLLKTASIMTEDELAAVAAAVAEGRRDSSSSGGGGSSKGRKPGGATATTTANGFRNEEKALEQEINVMKNLDHPNIVSLYEVINDPSSAEIYLIMQYIDKGSVARVKTDGSIDPDKVLSCDQLTRLAVQVCSGLQYLHGKGVVHRDIKPENILVSTDGHAYLADFGVAEVYTDEDVRANGLTAETCAFQGTPLFMAPEIYASIPISIGGGADVQAAGAESIRFTIDRLRKKLTTAGDNGDDDDGVLMDRYESRRDVATANDDSSVALLTSQQQQPPAPATIDPCALDVWALGVTFLTLLTGSVPFRSYGDIRTAGVKGPAFLIPASVPEDWCSMLTMMLQGDPAKRANIAAISAKLEAMAARLPATGDAAPPHQPGTTATANGEPPAAAPRKTTDSLLQSPPPVETTEVASPADFQFSYSTSTSSTRAAQAAGAGLLMGKNDSIVGRMLLGESSRASAEACVHSSRASRGRKSTMESPGTVTTSPATVSSARHEPAPPTDLPPQHMHLHRPVPTPPAIARDSPPLQNTTSGVTGTSGAPIHRRGTRGDAELSGLADPSARLMQGAGGNQPGMGELKSSKASLYKEAVNQKMTR